MTPCLQPMKNYRTSSDSVWPLRGADGLTFAESKAKEKTDEPRPA